LEKAVLLVSSSITVNVVTDWSVFDFFDTFIFLSFKRINGGWLCSTVVTGSVVVVVGLVVVEIVVATVVRRWWQPETKWCCAIINTNSARKSFTCIFHDVNNSNKNGVFTSTND
jgi:hypothetical protein